MNKSIFISILISLVTLVSHAQTGADTLHYNKIYYFAGTGLAIPMGKTKEVLSSQLFAGSMGLDIALNNKNYYLYPALYMFSFKYNQQMDDPSYNYKVENGQSSFYMLSMSVGGRKQFDRLNTYVYMGPTIGLSNQPRADVVNERIKMEVDRSIAYGTKIGVGADYRFKGFYLCGEVGYMYHVTKIEEYPFHALSILFGLKSDITRLSAKVVDFISTKK